MTLLSRRLLLATFLSILSFFFIQYTVLPSTSSTPHRFQFNKSPQETLCQTESSPKKIPEWDPSLLVKGAPTKLFRGSPIRGLANCYGLFSLADNLLEDRGYITSWTIAGFSRRVTLLCYAQLTFPIANQFMGYVRHFLGATAR